MKVVEEGCEEERSRRVNIFGDYSPVSIDMTASRSRAVYYSFC